MKSILYTFLLLLTTMTIQAQNENTEVVIISGDQELSLDDIEVTIKKNGKKLKVEKDQIKIIPNSQQGMSFNFGDMGVMDLFDSFQFESLRGRMSDMLRMFPEMDNIEEFDFQRDFETNPNDLLEFEKEFEQLGEQGTSEIELGEGDQTYIFKSDDGRPIIKDEEIIIEKKIEKAPEMGVFRYENEMEGNPVVFLNGKEYHGDIKDIDQSSIRSLKIEKGTAVIEKFGERAKDGVMYIITK